MALNENYILLYNLQQYIVDKSTGAPLANGTLSFYSDVNRTTLKNVYKYDSVNGYTVIPNPVQLSAVGTPTDGNGNDIAIYVFPYTDGTATTVELYYVVAASSLGTTQFTRESIPNFIENTSNNAVSFINYIPNGQFLLHTNIPSAVNTSGVTQIAYGGWTYEKESGSTSTDTITFNRYSAYTDNPTGNPRYAFQISTTTDTVSGLYRDIRVKFNDVNKFADPTQQYTLFFTAMSNSGSPLNNVTVRLIKNFGTGGTVTSPTDDVIDTITIPAVLTNFNIPITFGTNSGDNLGTNDDDYLQIAIGLPAGVACSLLATDFVLTPGDIQVEQFPSTTNAEFIAPSLAGWLPVPDYNAKNLGLPVILTSTGLGFSTADLGKVYGGLYANPNFGELLCDGSQYKTSAFSSDGIPYSRLQNILFNNSTSVPIYGTGNNFVTAYVEAADATKIIFTTNQAGTTTAPNNVSPLNFNITSIHTASSSNYGVRTFHFGANKVNVVNLVAGVANTPTANTSGFTIEEYINNSVSFHAFGILTTGANTFPTSGASAYFEFSNTITQYYVWFKVGASTDPAPGGAAGIQINLNGNETASDVALILLSALSGSQQHSIQTVAGSSITDSSYFTFGTPNSSNYYVWYNVSGAAVDPHATGTGIQVNISSSSSAAQVATATLLAINKTYFAIPDFRGMFLRGADTTGIWDTDYATRWGFVGGVYGAMLGSFEFDEIYQHFHPGSTVSAVDGAGSPTPVSALQGNATGDTLPLNIAAQGGGESRPLNTYVNWFIKY